MRIPTPHEVECFYRAAAAGLRLLDAREGRGRRFGDTANAAWKALGGEFEDRDRLDLLLRDGAGHQPLAFSPRLVFQMTWLADDEPFGPEWPQAPAAVAGALLRSERNAVSDTAELLADAAGAWGLPQLGSTPALSDHVGRVGPASNVLVSGTDAMFAVAQCAEGRRDLDLGEQVLLFACTPAERQFWGLALLALGSRSYARMISASDATAAKVRELGFSKIDVALVSNDAVPEVREAAAALCRELRT